ncbi:hypothetical protein L218DRAFT_877901, partial [Marasmius fiardii PR-910]
GVESKWALTAHSIFWTERVTVRRSIGTSPYFLAHGVHPVLPLDVYEATYLIPPPDSVLSTTNLLACCARELQKHLEDLEQMRQSIYRKCLDRVQELEKQHSRSIKSFDFSCGDLVLVRNTKFDKTIGNKTKMRYIGPLIVLTWNKGGAYIVCELDGTVWKRPVSTFHVIPYRPHKSLPLPNLDKFLDLSSTDFNELEGSKAQDEEGLENLDSPPDDDEFFCVYTTLN